MRRHPVVLSSLLLGALAPAWASGPFDDIGNLAYEHMAGCVTPYVESSLPEQDALLAIDQITKRNGFLESQL